MLTKKIDYISLFLLIYLSSSFVGIAMNGTLNILMMALVIIVNIVFKKNRFKIKKIDVVFMLIVLVSSYFTMLINTDITQNFFIFQIRFISGYLFSKLIAFDTFVTYFVKIMYLLSIFSLLTYLLIFVAPSFLELFPSYTNIVGFTVNNHILSVTHNSDYFSRNYGVFWEPGAYQIFLNLALFFQLYIIKEYDMKRIAVFIITIITTFSSTGYISLFLLISIFFLSLKTIGRNTRKIILFLIISIPILLFIISRLPDHIYFAIFGKLEILFRPSLSQSSSSYISTQVRFAGGLATILGLIRNPLFGVGFTELKEISYSLGGDGMLTSTPLNWFGLFGAVFGVVFNYPLWRWTRVSQKKILVQILLMFFLVLLFISENFINNVFYIFFLFIIFNKQKEYITKTKVSEK